MKSSSLNMNLTLLWGLVIVLKSNSIQATLLFPAASVFQITASIAAPIVLPGRKLYWDWGLQMNYDLPFNLKQFYNVPIWPDTLEERKRRGIELQTESNVTFWHNSKLNYENAEVESGKHPSDFTAGELYHSFENLLVSYGFHETCLLRSVCELARHPFADDQQNILTEVLTFILTPSIHDAFSPLETVYREVYEESERRGFLHYNCGELYHECKQDLLTSITNVITNSRRDYNYND